MKAEKIKKTDKVCRNCRHSYKRSWHDIQRYGSYFANFECLAEERKYPIYVASDHTCERFEK